MRKRINTKDKLFAVLLFFIISVSTFIFYFSDLTTYGGTWDELFFHMGTGKDYVDFLKTGNLKPILENPNSSWFPPIAPTIGYLFQDNKFLESKIPFATDRFHLAALIFGSVTVGAVFLIVWLLTENIFVGLLSSTLLLFHPQFVTQSHINVRDMGLTMFYTLTILMFLLFSKTKHKFVFMIVSGILAGITTATKQNGMFLVFIGVVWFTIHFHQLKIKKYIGGMILFCLFFVSSFIFFWPYLWVDTISHLFLMWHFLTDPSIIAGSTTFFDHTYTSMRDIPIYYPWTMLFILTPLPYAVLGVLGFLLSIIFAGSKNKGLLLILLWIGVPLSRFLFPLSSISYDQIRHFFEVVPTLSIFSALGIYYLNSIYNKGYARILFKCVALGAIIYTVMITFRYRPYGTSYFNVLAGPSSYVNHAFDIEYYGNVYRQASVYLNNKYGGNTTYYTASLGAHIFQNDGLMGKMTDNPQEYFDYAIFMNKQTWLRNNPFGIWLVKNKKPIYTIEREGKILFYIFQNHYSEYQKTI